ncbi:expressed unknown protein [Seminavis robusta]|uniref:Uncharacterized protein n=1 Tax=Seminavis robusta TaxID=568900 RepID=A0A9N8DPS0_9STRA|nr:expressed unknown protein [Seminavis robusta]|eukprot:Sro173_g076451.1  (298) ;mRNA; f:93171-94064
MDSTKVGTFEHVPESVPSILHVKGHQDDAKPYDELNLEAQLNIDADQLADDWLQAHPNFDHSKVPILPTSGCQINLPYGTFTHNIKHELKLARSVPDNAAFLMDKYEWDQEIFDDIDWTCHGRALNRTKAHQTSMIKYLIGWHPVGTRVNKYDPKYPIACASCGYHEEDKDHVMSCPKRQTDRDNWKKAIKQYLDKHNTHPSLHATITSALNTLLDDGDIESIEHNADIQDIIDSQHNIGWEHIFKGRFSKLWAQNQDQHLKDNNLKTPRKNGQSWLTGLIHEMQCTTVVGPLGSPE